jgi:hypothetical protein
MADQAINYEAVLADLIQRRDALNSAIDAVRRIVGTADGSPGETEAPPTMNGPRPAGSAIRADSFFGLSVGDAIVKYLEISRQPRSLTQIAEALQQGGLTHRSKQLAATVSTTLKRRSESPGDVVKVKRGLWGLQVWYGSKRSSLSRPENGDGSA